MSYSVRTLQSSSNPIEALNVGNLKTPSVHNGELVTLSIPAKHQKRVIAVNGTAEMSLPPNKVKLVIIIKSVKEKIEDAKQSVHRRFEYIYQTLRKNRINEASINVAKIFYRHEKNFEVITEVSTTFDDFNKFQTLYNIMIEKLDKTVRILEPQFFHSNPRMDNIKHQASIQAIKNAKRLAVDLARSVNLAVGKPLEISEEKIREDYAGGLAETNTEYSSESLKSLAQLINEKTVKIIVNVNVTFELRPYFKKDQFE